MGRLVRSVAGLLHWWWYADRIRVSPREGRLLRLAPPCFLRIAGAPARVLRRRVVGPVVVYHCTTAAGACDLLVRPAAEGHEVVVRRNGDERVLAEEDVEVFPAAQGASCSRRFNS